MLTSFIYLNTLIIQNACFTTGSSPFYQANFFNFRYPVYLTEWHTHTTAMAGFVANKFFRTLPGANFSANHHFTRGKSLDTHVQV